MPRGQGTGPMGKGAMTGRSAGYCTGNAMPGYANKKKGRGLGSCRRGQRQQCLAARGRRQGRSPGNVTPLQMPGQLRGKFILRDKADALQAELNHLRARLDEIEP